jgi:hypothetical protein
MIGAASMRKRTAPQAQPPLSGVKGVFGVMADVLSWRLLASRRTGRRFDIAQRKIAPLSIPGRLKRPSSIRDRKARHWMAGDERC